MTASTPEVHPLLAALPLLEGADFDALVEDVRANGLLHAIVLDPSGRILDGRNRLLACAAAKIKPDFRTYDGPAAEYIVSANLHRRHLTPGQKAMFGVAFKQAIAAREGKPVGGRGVTAQPPEDGGEVSDRHARESSSQAGKRVGVSGKSIDLAERIERDAPDLAAEVRAGEISLAAAERRRARRVGERATPESPLRPRMVAAWHLDGTTVPLPNDLTKCSWAILGVAAAGVDTVTTRAEVGEALAVALDAVGDSGAAVYLLGGAWPGGHQPETQGRAGSSPPPGQPGRRQGRSSGA